MKKTAWGAAIALFALLILLQAPLTGAHEGQHDPGDSHDNREGEFLSPNASPLTEEAEYIRQENPSVYKDRVVWEETEIGHPTNIVAYNTSTDAGPFPLSTRAIEEANPDTRGPWIAWEQHHQGDNATTDIAVFDVRTGTTHEVPDHGHHQYSPSIGGNTTVYYAEDIAGETYLRGFDLERRTVWAPIGDTPLLEPPSAHGSTLAWAEGSPTKAKIKTMDLETGTTETVPDRWNLREGPVVGPHGIAFVTSSFARSGANAVLYNEDLGVKHLRSGVYPHENLDHCEDGIVWDQPGTSVSDLDHIAVWDPHVEKETEIGSNNTNPACGNTQLVYEKLVTHEDEEEPIPRLYHLDMRDIRRRGDAEIQLAPQYEKGIFSEPVTFEGTAKPGDPREPIEQVLVRVDQGTIVPAETQPIEDGVAWRVTIDPNQYPSGVRTLDVLAEDALGTKTLESFTFYTDTPFEMDQSRLDTTLDVPRTEPSPFPFSVLDHYKAYQPFYNTVLLLLLLVGGAIYGVHRYRSNQPTDPPEYVPPDEL